MDEVDRGQPRVKNPARNPDVRVLAWADELIRGYLQDFGDAVRSSIEYAFGTRASNLRRRTPSRHAVDCFLRVCNQKPSWEIEVRFDRDEVVVRSPDSRDWLTYALSSERLRESSRAPLIRSFAPLSLLGDRSPLMWDYLNEDLEATLFPDWPSPAIHLPAGRTGIMHSYQVLAGSVVQQSTAAGIRPIGIDPLPGTAADFLSLILSPRSVRYRSDPPRTIQDIADNIEKAMRAEVVVDRAEGQPVDSVIAMTPEGRFSLWRTSSMISELAPIVLVLKHSIGVNGYLTIDEPESHLHPQMQRHIASSFAHLINSGLHVLITTHSDYLVEAISNLIRKSEVQSYRRDRSTSRVPQIDRSKVKALRFSRESRWCLAQSVDISPVGGIDDSTFTDVMEEQYDESAELIDGLLEMDDAL